MKWAFVSFVLSALLCFSTTAKISKNPPSNKKSFVTQGLLKRYKNSMKGVKGLKKLKSDTLNFGGQAVPALIQVMKDKSYPEKNRWVATFLLGRIMGDKSAPFISKFLKHPNWIMRMASLKTLLAMKQKKYGKYFAEALKDKAFIIRIQALENIKQLKLKNYSSHVWAMLYDKKNYYTPTKKGRKRTNIVKKAIRIVGDLKFKKASPALLTMIQKKKYNDIFEDLEYALSKIHNKRIPNGNKSIKRRFWKKFKLKTTVI